MKMKKFFWGIVCAVVMGLTACGDGEEDIAGVQTLQPEQISTEKGNNGQEETAHSDVQGIEMQGTESQKTEMQQSEIQESEQNQNNADGIEGQGTEVRQPEIQESQQQDQNDTDSDLEERLAQYRAEREGMTNVAMGNGVSGYGAPNAENFGFQADTTDYTQNFDSRELNKAYETAKKYVTETLAISVETNAVVYPCIDPRITEIYEAEDKGVADGYDSKNIFVCEYCDNGTWQYLILVRDGKDSDWSVIHHVGSYKE